MKRFILIILCCIPLITHTGCDKNVYPISATEFMLDTVITVTVYDGDGNALRGALELCKQYENLLSKTVKTSDIYKINHSGGMPTEVNPETVELLNTALNIAAKSNGAFDPTVLPLVTLWDVQNRTFPPCVADIKDKLNYVNYNNIIISQNTVTAQGGAQLDLGGIAKGFIADRIKEYLKVNGITSGVINLGGNTLLIGNKNGSDFTVGLQKPFGKNGELSATLELTDKTAVTSGIYQRYFEADGKIYHHIIDPYTGYPCDNGIASVTVITESSCIADGLSTACLNLGIEKGIELAKQYGAELIYITASGELILTDGLIKTYKDNRLFVCLKT